LTSGSSPAHILAHDTRSAATRRDGSLAAADGCRGRFVSGSSVLDSVSQIVIAVAGPDRTPIDAGPDTLLCDGGFWLDSVSLLELALACEATFGIDPTRDLPSGTIASVRTLASIIEPKRPPSDPGINQAR
jgi:acyl carrier protein